jgi:phosphate starvation-inducible protein PhoH and related proteins
MKKRIYLNNRDEVMALLGEYDKNIRAMEKRYGVSILYSENEGPNNFIVELDGPKSKVAEAHSKLLELKGSPKGHSDAERGAPVYSGDTLYIAHSGKEIVPLTENQRNYANAIRENDMVISIGPAGTGKTFLAVASALAALENGRVNRIVLSRPVVESGERLGFLPGDLYEKVSPYLKPLYDAFYTMLGPDKFHRYREETTIEIVPLAYMRGRTLENAFIVLDEAQNTVPEQMKMFLTRLGSNSKAVITGDITQIDLENKKQSGLIIVKEILSGIDGIKITYFSEKDVIRHKLVKKIIKAYEKWEETNGA